MNALSLYIRACRNILQAGENAAAWLETQHLLTYLREALACTACGRLLVNPRTSATCSHSICKNCAESKSHIPLCKDCDDFHENSQTVIILQCYRKLCEYLLYHRRYFSFGSNSEFNALVQEGASYRSDYQLQINYESEEERSEHSVLTNGNACCYTLGIKRDQSPTSGEDDMAKDDEPSASRYKVKRQGCRCGMATQNPGKLTCCGQRCPCYVGNKSCFSCRCRGCRNPHRVNDHDLRILAESDSSLQSSDCDI